MPKAVHDDVLDGAFNVIKSATSIQVTVCDSEPTTFSHATKVQASAGYMLAADPMGKSSFVIANGSSGGRKITTVAQTSVSVDDSGSANWVTICGSGKMLLKTTCTKQNLTKGNKVNIPAFSDTIADPT